MGFLVRLRHYLDLGHLTIFNIRLFRDVPRMVGDVLGWKGIVLSFMREEILGPRLNDSINCLGEQVPVPALVPWVSRNVEGHVFTRPASAPETHFHPSLRHLVQQGNVLRKPYGMPQGGGEASESERYTVGATGQVGGEKDWVRGVAEPFRIHVVLGQPNSVKAQLLAEQDLLTNVVQHL